MRNDKEGEPYSARFAEAEHLWLPRSTAPGGRRAPPGVEARRTSDPGKRMEKLLVFDGFWMFLDVSQHLLAGF